MFVVPSYQKLTFTQRILHCICIYFLVFVQALVKLVLVCVTCITLGVFLLLSTVRKYICRNYQINTKLYPASSALTIYNNIFSYIDFISYLKQCLPCLPKHEVISIIMFLVDSQISLSYFYTYLEQSQNNVYCEIQSHFQINIINGGNIVSDQHIYQE